MIDITPARVNRQYAPREESWSPLTYFFIYRLTAALFLLAAFLGKWGLSFLGQQNPGLYTLTAIAYLGLVMASGLFLQRRAPTAGLQASLMVLTDIICITLMLHASSGIQTGMGALIAVSIAAGSLMMRGSAALLLSAVATLAVLTQQTVATINGTALYTGYPQAGMLGASFFAIATLALVLSQRASKSEQLVSKQELDLANLAQLNDYVIQHMQTGILVVDSDRRIRLINDAAWYLLGMPDASPGKTLEQASQSLADRMISWSEKPDRELQSFRPATGGRELKPGFSRLGRTGTYGTVIFLEDKASVTQQAQQIKLASLGRLTASIAHEIRNPLGAIGHADQLLQESAALPAGERRLVEIIGTNTRRVNDIIENVLQLSRRTQSRPREFPIQEWLEEFAGEFRSQHHLPAGALTLEIDPVDTIVFADPTQLRQILTNLCENSLRHFQRDRKELRIRFKGGITRASGGPYLDLIDNGPGIPAEHTRHVFEPFFTTESSGTGLGLYIAKELSESNRMRLEYLPVAAGGSCFRMNFPGARTARREI